MSIPVLTGWQTKLEITNDNANAFETSNKAKLKLGLFSYPVLQAADILLYRATHVPVGQDQSQHLEFARACADSFNHVHGKVLVPPQTLLSPAKRIMALHRPDLKMSKSHKDPRSRILLNDSTDDVYAKIRSALTDSEDGIWYDTTRRPGVSNLIDIAYHMGDTGAASAQDLAKDFRHLSIKALKEHVAREVDRHIAPIRDGINSRLGGGIKELDEVAAAGQQKAAASAAKTMALVRDAVGLS